MQLAQAAAEMERAGRELVAAVVQVVEGCLPEMAGAPAAARGEMVPRQVPAWVRLVVEEAAAHAVDMWLERLAWQERRPA